MNYGELQSTLQGLLNRRDATTAQIQAWLQNGLMRIQRELRCPAMEKTVVVTIASGYAGLIIPSDMIELIRLVNSQGIRITKEDISTVNRLAINTGFSQYYCREGGAWLLGPSPVIADTIKIVYYAELGDLSLSTDSNVISQIAGDLCIYAGLGYAADFFTDRRTAAWEVRYQQILGDIQQQADEDELSGGSVVSAALHYPDDMYGAW